MGEGLHEIDKLIWREGINVPIVLIIFNRPDKTEKVFAEIARIKPKKLFVFSDGPKSEIDREKVLAVRESI